MDAIDFVMKTLAGIGALAVPVGTFLGIRQITAGSRDVEKTKAQSSAANADIEGQYGLAEKRLEMNVERDKLEITGQVDITKLALASAETSRELFQGVAEALNQCEARSKVAAEAHKKELAADAAAHKQELHETGERFNRMMTDISARYEKILAEQRAETERLLASARVESDRRDASTRAEVKVILDNASAAEATFQEAVKTAADAVKTAADITRRFDEYRLRHPSDPTLAAVKGPAKG